ncbi:hypothetical protein Tco_0432810 [Tanacetum coccineum]
MVIIASWVQWKKALAPKDNGGLGYTVAFVKKHDRFAITSKGDLKTRWIRYVPNKVNTFAWKVLVLVLSRKQGFNDDDALGLISFDMR